MLSFYNFACSLFTVFITDTQDIIEEIKMCSPLGNSAHAVLKVNCKINSLCTGRLYRQTKLQKV